MKSVSSGVQTMKSVSASQRRVTGIQILTPGRKKSHFEEQKLKCSAANSLLPHISQAHPNQLSMLFRSWSTKNFKYIKTEKEKGFRCNNQPTFLEQHPPVSPRRLQTRDSRAKDIEQALCVSPTATGCQASSAHFLESD